MKRITSLLLIELFLIQTFGIEFALAQGNFPLSNPQSALRNPASPAGGPQSTLRPRSGQSAAEIQSALDGGKRRTKSEYLQAHQELTAQLKRYPDIQEVAKYLGVSVSRASRQMRKLKQPLSPMMPANASPLTRYARGRTTELPSPGRTKLSKRPADGMLMVNVMGVSIGSLPKSLGSPDKDEIQYSFRHADGENVWVDLKPSWAPEPEPEHARRRLIVEGGKITVDQKMDQTNRSHHLRRLKTMGIDYETLPSALRALTPTNILEKINIFMEFNEPVGWKWITKYSPEKIRDLLTQYQEREAAKATVLKHLYPPRHVRETLGSEREILARVQLIEKYVPFHPLYWGLIGDSTRQEILEKLPYLQFLHLVLRLYGIQTLALRNRVIAASPDTFLSAGSRTQLRRLRRALRPFLENVTPPLYFNELSTFTSIFRQPEQRRDALLKAWLQERVDRQRQNGLSDPRRALQRLKLFALYDRYLESKGKRIVSTLNRLENFIDVELQPDIEAFRELLLHLQEGAGETIRRTRPVTRSKTPPRWLTAPHPLPRLQNVDEFQDYEQIEIRKLGEYLITHHGETLSYDQILKDNEANFILIDSSKTLQRALAILTRIGSIHAYRKDGIKVIDPWVLPENIDRVLGRVSDEASRQARDGGKRIDRATFRNLHQALQKEGHPPDAVDMVEFLGISKDAVRARIRRAGDLELSPMPRTTPLRRYRDGLVQDIPPDQLVMLHRFGKSGSLMITLADLPVIGLPESLGGSRDKVFVHYESVGKKTRDLIVTLKPSFASEAEPAHVRFRLVVKEKHLASEKKTYDPDRQHSIRRLQTLGIDFESLPDYIQRFAPSQILKKALLFQKYGRPVLWGWVQRYSEEGIRNRLEAVQRGRMKNVFIRKRSAEGENAERRIAFNNSLTRLLKKEGVASPGEFLWEVEAIGWYLSQQKKRTLLPYDQLLKKVSDLQVIDSVETLKRALGFLSQRGFILAYKTDGVVVLDPWFPPSNEPHSRYARDGGKRTPSWLTPQPRLLEIEKAEIPLLSP